MIVHYCCNELINHNSITHPHEPQLIKLKPEILNISNSGLFFILPIKVLNIRYSENRDQNNYDDRKGISHETQIDKQIKNSHKCNCSYTTSQLHQ